MINFYLSKFSPFSFLTKFWEDNTGVSIIEFSFLIIPVLLIVGMLLHISLVLAFSASFELAANRLISNIVENEFECRNKTAVIEKFCGKFFIVDEEKCKSNVEISMVDFSGTESSLISDEFYSQNVLSTEDKKLTLIDFKYILPEAPFLGAQFFPSGNLFNSGKIESSGENTYSAYVIRRRDFITIPHGCVPPGELAPEPEPTIIVDLPTQPHMIGGNNTLFGFGAQYNADQIR